jgi:hypothetical protein
MLKEILCGTLEQFLIYAIMVLILEIIYGVDCMMEKIDDQCPKIKHDK